MAYAYSVRVERFCDQCGARGPHAFASSIDPQWATDIAAQPPIGWAEADSKLFCPECV